MSDRERECVLIGTLPPPTTGQAIAFRMLADGCARRGVPHRVVDISERGGGRGRARDGRGGSARGAERPVGGFSWRRVLSFVPPLCKVAWRCVPGRRKNVYLIIAQSWFGFLRDRLFVGVAGLRRHRIVLHVHGGGYGEFWAAQPPARQRRIVRVLARADRIVVLGQGLVDMLDFLPDHRARTVVVPNGLALDEARLPRRPKALPEAGSGPIRLLFLSNLIESKGWLDVLEAVRILIRDRGLDVTCDFCGAFLVGADAERFHTVADAERGFRELVQEHGLAERVRHRGLVHGIELASALELAHFLVLPTRYDNEGQPLCIIEAMAYGCVVLSTRYRAIPEMLDDGRAGLFVDAGRPETIVDAVAACRDDPARYAALSERAMAHRAEHYTIEAHLDRLIGVITGEHD